MSIEYSSTRNPQMKAKVTYSKFRSMCIENSSKIMRDNSTNRFNYLRHNSYLKRPTEILMKDTLI